MSDLRKCLNISMIEDIILVDVLDFKKPERAGSHCRGLAAKAAEKIVRAIHLPAPAATPLTDMKCSKCGSVGDVFVLCAGCQSPLTAPAPLATARDALERMAGHDPRDPGLSWDDNLLLIQSAAQAAKDILASQPQPADAAPPSEAPDDLDPVRVTLRTIAADLRGCVAALGDGDDLGAVLTGYANAAEAVLKRTLVTRADGSTPSAPDALTPGQGRPE